MSITIDATETAELRRALLEDLPSVARRFEDVAPEDATRLRWCLWQELVLLRALGWRGEVFEHEHEHEAGAGRRLPARGPAALSPCERGAGRAGRVW